MICSIVHDPLLLSQASLHATRKDLSIAQDLLDTLAAHRHECVGMAANMIGQKKSIIAVDFGPFCAAMLNPCIIKQEKPYQTEESCLSLAGKRPVMRYQTITVSYRDMEWKEHTQVFTGIIAQIIQHEIDHVHGILI